MGYEEARQIQERLALQRLEGRIHDLVLALEHPPVVTVGRGWDGRRVGERATERVPALREGWLRVGRGGGPTYHGPGQLVVYPLVALRSRGRAVRAFVEALEGALCETAASYGVRAVGRPGLPGAWIDAPDGWRKLGSVGIAVRRGITLHGGALNVHRSCETGFADFAPCGLAGVRPTSIESERPGPAPALAEVARIVSRMLAARLEAKRDLRELEPRDIEVATAAASAAAAPASPSLGAGRPPKERPAPRPPAETPWT